MTVRVRFTYAKPCALPGGGFGNKTLQDTQSFDTIFDALKACKTPETYCVSAEVLADEDAIPGDR